AIAVWYDNRDLPQQAKHFYQRALEERNHAMMLLQYRLDRDMGLVIPAVPAVRHDFTSEREPIALALEQEKRVTEQIEALVVASRAANDALWEQFMPWFLKEQVAEVGSTAAVLMIIKRAGNLFDVETYLARETSGNAGQDADGPSAAGGAI